MKSVVKPLSVITTILYVAGMIAAAFYLYKLPDSLVEQSAVLDLVSVQEVAPAINELRWIISIALLTGLVSLMSQVMVASGSNRENVVYVERFLSEKTDTEAEQQEVDGEQVDTSSLSQEILNKIKETAAAKEAPQVILEKALRVVCTQLEASQGAVYVTAQQGQTRFLELCASFAYMKPDSQLVRFEFGEGLPGQVAKEGQAANLNKVPDGYIQILSGLGKASPKNLLLVPIMAENKVAGVVEIASFTSFSQKQLEVCRQSFSLLTKHFKAASEKVDTSSWQEEEKEVIVETRPNI